MQQLPEVGDPVLIVDDQDRVYLSRVEDLTPDTISVAQPPELPATEPHAEGDELLLSWTTPTGVMGRPVKLVGYRIERTIRLWDLIPAGEPWVQQRRAHVRVPAAGPMTLVPAGEDPSPVTGRVVDISEAALQCLAEQAADDERLGEGAEVSAQFRLREEQFALGGVIHSSRPGERSGQLRLVIRFDHTESEADALRRQIFALQMDARRLGLR